MLAALVTRKFSLGAAASSELGSEGEVGIAGSQLSGLSMGT
jgi:hypothetical protein